MIHHDVVYVRPASYGEAFKAYGQFFSEEKIPYYYAGGTEYISRARMNEVMPDVLIDLKGIPEMDVLEVARGKIVMGANQTLTGIVEANIFPLLTAVARGIATRTARNKITLGGNLWSHLPYRETVLPLLLADAELVIVGEAGAETRKLADVWNGRISLGQGEFILQIVVDEAAADSPFYYVKKTRASRVNYPIVTLASLVVAGDLRVACSGVGADPWRLDQLDVGLVDERLPVTKRVAQVLRALPEEIVSDVEASGKYRQFVLETVLTNMLEEQEGADGWAKESSSS